MSEQEQEYVEEECPDCGSHEVVRRDWSIVVLDTQCTNCGNLWEADEDERQD